MSRIVIAIAAVASLLVTEGATALAPGPRPFEFDAAGNTLEIEVYKGGLLGAFGHDHVIAAKEFSGRVLLDPERLQNSSVTLRVAARALTVVDTGISDADRARVQSTMLSDKVLDVARFSEIVFVSTGVIQARKNGDSWNLTLAGRLSLHGVEKEATFPVTLRIADGELEADGEVFLRQTDYGITPVKVAGGMVKVKDTLRIHFAIHARGTSP
jgi:polyisoprenoid-binding protein YceI